MNIAANKRIWLQRFALIVTYYMVAAAAQSGMFEHWAFRDGSSRASLISILEGTADRPFVYRQLLPTIANRLDQIVPERIKSQVQQGMHLSRTFALALDADSPQYGFRYIVVYGLTFLSLFCSLFVLRSICQQLIGDGMGASFAPAIFALFLPYVMTVGNYFYDSSELLFLSLSIWLCIRPWGAYALPLLTLVAIFNKESFLFFIPALYPLLRIRHSKIVAAGTLAVCGSIAVALNLVMKHAFRDNPGAVVEFHLLDGLHAYSTVKTYLLVGLTYGLPSPAGMSVIAIAAIATLFTLGWPSMPRVLRHHFAIAAAINVPLFLLLCFPGELRNFSLVFVSVVCLMCCAIDSGYGSMYRHTP